METLDIAKKQLTEQILGIDSERLLLAVSQFLYAKQQEEEAEEDAWMLAEIEDGLKEPPMTEQEEAEFWDWVHQMATRYAECS
ncbi:MAG: hypothetical protein LBO69_07620 [Ignavibacteria bacterium]|jgi:hypothetical protein|nr:hypothetical protein [Ignavibacteria bacterium]